MGAGAILVTRPQRQAQATAARLAALGHRALVAPLCDIVVAEAVPELSGDVQAILITSGNAVEALRRMAPPPDLPVLAVGERTAQAARGAGCGTVLSAQGDAAALSRLALERLLPGNGPVLHLRGAKIGASPLVPLLHAGFETRQIVVYETRYRDAFERETAALLEQGGATAALVYSPASAKALRHACAPLTLPSLPVMAISDAAAEPLRGAQGFAPLHIAEAPNEDAMFALLGQAIPPR